MIQQCLPAPVDLEMAIRGAVMPTAQTATSATSPHVGEGRPGACRCRYRGLVGAPPLARAQDSGSLTRLAGFFLVTALGLLGGCGRAPSPRLAASHPTPSDLVVAAALQGNLPELDRLLKLQPELVNEPDRNGLPILLRVVGSVAPKMPAIRDLIARGATVNAKDGTGSTALDVAAGKGNTEIIRFLLSHGANPNILDRSGANAVFRAVRAHHLDAARLLVTAGASEDVFTAAALGDGQRLAALLAKDPALANATRPAGESPLQFAAIWCRHDSARLLLARGADRNHRDAAGNTAAQIATMRGCLPVASLLSP